MVSPGWQPSSTPAPWRASESKCQNLLLFLGFLVTEGQAMGAIHQPQISNAHLDVHQATLKKAPCCITYKIWSTWVRYLQNHILSIAAWKGLEFNTCLHPLRHWRARLGDRFPVMSQWPNAWKAMVSKQLAVGLCLFFFSYPAIILPSLLLLCFLWLLGPRSCSLPEASIQFKAIGKSCSGKLATCMASYDGHAEIWMSCSLVQNPEFNFSWPFWSGNWEMTIIWLRYLEKRPEYISETTGATWDDAMALLCRKKQSRTVSSCSACLGQVLISAPMEQFPSSLQTSNRDSGCLVPNQATKKKSK